MIYIKKMKSKVVSMKLDLTISVYGLRYKGRT